MLSARSALCAVLIVVGLPLVGLGLLLGASGYGTEGFPAGLALVFGLLAFAGGGGALGGAALLSGPGLRRAQRTALNLAGLLAVAAFLLPAVGLVLAPELLFEGFGMDGLVVAVLGWLLLTAASLAVAVGVGVWRSGELLYARFTQ